MEGANENINIQAKEGMIGFFDILGFQNYIKNDPDIESKRALEIILKLKSDGPVNVKKRFNFEILNEVEWSVLSDTIVLTVQYPQTKPRQNLEEVNLAKKHRWLALIFSAIALIDFMFDEGLPVRGAIAYGKYFVKDQSLAGKPIVEALALAQNLNLSGTVISNESVKQMESIDMDPKEFSKKWIGGDPLFFEYLVPLKGEMQKFFVLNQWSWNDKHLNSDIPQLVAQVFWKHGKDMDSSVFQKYQNTEMLLRYLVAMRRGWRSN